MKKFALMAVAACFTIASCSDDDSTNTNTAAIEGQWDLTSVTSLQPVDANNDGVASTNFKAETGCFNNSNIIFGAGNIAELNLEVPFFTSCFETTTNASYVSNNDSVTFTITDEDGPYTETVALNGNTITVDTEYEVEIDINGSTQTTSIPMVMVYTKL